MQTHISSPRSFALRFAAYLLGASFLAGTAAEMLAQDNNALVDALVRKGVLTNQEATDIRTDLAKDLAATSAGKIKLSSSITELKLYGDFRYRYQYDDIDTQLDNGTNLSQRSRHRFRLRLNADVQLGREWFGGFALETSQASDSGNQTFENGFDDYSIFIAKAFVGWRPSDWFTAVIGKQKNPFYTTDLGWDPDINPNGLTETIAFHKLFNFGGGKSPLELTLVAGQFVFDDNNEFNLDSDLNTDAYLFVEQLIATYKFNKDTSLTVAPGFMTFTAADLTGLQNTNAFTDTVGFAQTGVTDQVTTSTVATVQDTVAANGLTTTRVTTPTTVQTTVTTTTNPDGTRTVATSTRTLRAGAPTTVVLNQTGVRNQQTTNVQTVAATTAAPVTRVASAGAPVSGETRQLHILTAPGDFSFKLGGLSTKLYWDLAYNLGGRRRFEDIYQLRTGGSGVSYSGRDGLAWLVGLQFGETKKKGDWSIFGNYREIGIASIDPNLNDSDFANSELNVRGFKVGVAYQLADAVVFNITGITGWNLNEDLTGGRATGLNGIAKANSFRLLQVDLNVKF